MVWRKRGAIDQCKKRIGNIFLGGHGGKWDTMTPGKCGEVGVEVGLGIDKVAI